MRALELAPLFAVPFGMSVSFARTRALGTLAAVALLAACNTAVETDPSADQTGDTPVSAEPDEDQVAARDPAAEPSPAPSQTGEEPCNANRAQSFVGKKADPQTRADLASAVSPVSDIRWVAPGMATTEDYRIERLNVMLDQQDTIVSLHCG